MDFCFRDIAAALQLPVFEVDLCDMADVVDRVHEHVVECILRGWQTRPQM